MNKVFSIFQGVFVSTGLCIYFILIFIREFHFRLAQKVSIPMNIFAIITIFFKLEDSEFIYRLFHFNIYNLFNRQDPFSLLLIFPLIQILAGMITVITGEYTESKIVGDVSFNIVKVANVKSYDGHMWGSVHFILGLITLLLSMFVLSQK